MDGATEKSGAAAGGAAGGRVSHVQPAHGGG